MRCMFVYGMSRAGNHAIVKWIQDQVKGTSTFFNHCYKGWDKNKLIPSSDPSIVQNSGEDIVNIYSIEEFRPEYWAKKHMESLSELNEGPTTIVCILRDPFNWLASSWKLAPHPTSLYTNELGDTSTRIDIFESQVDEFYGATDYINKSIVYIKYNDWFTDKTYRKELVSKLCLSFSDKTLDTVSGWSSFQSSREGAQQMSTLTRWEHYWNDIDFRNALSKKLIDFSEKEFNINPFKRKRYPL